MLRGRWDEAERRLRSLLARDADPGANLANPLALLGRIFLRRGIPAARDLIDRAWRVAAATGKTQKMAIATGARLELAWLTGCDADVRAVGTEVLDLATSARHSYLHGEALRFLRRIGESVPHLPPFSGCPPPLTAGVSGDWQATAALWEKASNPCEQALELVESSDLNTVRDGLAILDGLGAVAAGAIVRRTLRTRGVRGVRGVPSGPRTSSRATPAA
jgi:hypothetical protein